MKITILSIAPELFSGWIREKEQRLTGTVSVQIMDMRDSVRGSFRAVDDSPYGGGAGMVVRCEPVINALTSLGVWPEKPGNCRIAALTPAGELFTRIKAQKLAEETDHLILICGHYEGFDERIYTYCDEQYSIGDYVLSGGELPAMVITEAIMEALKLQQDSPTGSSV